MPNIPHPLRIVVLLGLFALVACDRDDPSRPIGLSRDAPSDLTVFNSAPLSVPPDYTVRPPRTGVGASSDSVPAPVVVTTQAASPPGAALDEGEQALVEAAGPPAPGDIRREVDRDAQVDPVDRSFSDRIMSWRPPPSTGGPDDPPRIIQPGRSSGFLGSIF